MDLNGIENFNISDNVDFLKVKKSELSNVLNKQNSYIEQLNNLNTVANNQNDKYQTELDKKTFQNQRELKSFQSSELGEIRTQHSYIYYSHMLGVMMIVFSIIYIALMSIIQIDIISPFAIILAIIISYKISPSTMRWLLSNNKRMYDDWFVKKYPRN